MENYSVYEDIAHRTGGDIYIGVVGPVRTGKSTFIKRVMETLVIPAADEKVRAEMTDELPQSAAGKTVMTTEPKFVPKTAAKITVAKGADVSVRLVDCVGFAVDGASGFEEDGSPRLVNTPWHTEPMPFEQAAAIGTEKVIREHSTIGVLVTTDGSITDISRENYVAAEERAVRELQGIDKPFVILLNCKNPSEVSALKKTLEEKYGVPVVAMNVEKMGESEMLELFQKILFEFPVMRIDVKLPKWLRTFAEDHGAVHGALSAVKNAAANIRKMRDCFALETLFDSDADYLNPDEIRMDLGKGRAEITIGTKEEFFYRTISETCGEELRDHLSLMQYLKAVASIKKDYDKVKDALKEAAENGYGIVYPREEDYTLEKPQLVKKGASYGVEFKARASGYHIVRVDVTGQISPIIGSQQQGEDFVNDTLRAYEEGEERVWETSIFGKSLRSLVEGEMAGKSNAMPVELRKKMRRIVTKIVNDGKTNVFCLIF
ncbi:MAG: stage IV sporulation protein A [Clostridia bacterium]|nr:stage IV sporulation protein A [Clostridia bacterium]